MTPLAVDPPQRITRLTPLAQACAWIDRTIVPVAPRRLAAAVGAVLAADVTCAERRPGRALALRDGWAVRSEDTVDAGTYAPALLSQPALRLDTGEALPAGVDAVAAIDAVSDLTGTSEAIVPVAPGEGVIAVGADAEAGAPLRRAGETLRAIDVAVLNALGIVDVAVRAPRIRIAAARNDGIVDAIVGFIAGQIGCAGGAVDVAAPGTALAADGFDLLIRVGGTGSGRSDRSVRDLAAAGRLDMHGIALAPGETTALGALGSTPVLIVPGRLDAAVAVWLVLGRRMLARLQSGHEHEASVAATLTRKVVSSLGLAELVLVRRDAGNVTPLPGGYLSPATLAAADGWLLVPPDSEGCPAGTLIDVKAMP